MSMFHRQVWTERTLSHDYMQVDRSCQCTIGNPFIRHSGDTIFPRETNVLTSGTCRAQDITHSYWSLGSSLSSSKFSLSSFEAFFQNFGLFRVTFRARHLVFGQSSSHRTYCLREGLPLRFKQTEKHTVSLAENEIKAIILNILAFSTDKV